MNNDPRRELFRNANFRWLIGGGLLSMLGDQFTLPALPWLVMSLSRDPLVLGTVPALGRPATRPLHSGGWRPGGPPLTQGRAAADR
ncbi:hypothetical protein J2X20_001961 [Pelomonas saccharophila]|uniref:Uncharacterized protein n=1 Tax=Roseateles saccharophilus TaxID=304 RepID=A0ABU1YKF5_ROSSA|nr:hypothetical protein [Roseateles saccharophilus]MDR7269332.1 hypothetical protein [Roseateles saccharophilus]